MLNCPVCGSEIPEIVEKCFTCGFHAGPPNVRAAEGEVGSLEARYQAALHRAQTAGTLSIVEDFYQVMSQSSAIVNVNLNFLNFFVTDANSLYTNYEGGIAGRARKPAAIYDDAKRRGVGGTLFGGYAGEIIYGALSLDGSGPISYGPFAIKLKEVAVRNRATVLEANSYEFVKQNELEPGDPRPLGFLASWPNRNKLAVAKLAEYITPTTRPAEFVGLVLASTGDRATDQFIEVHIYGTFDLNAVESVRGSSQAVSKDDRDLLRMVKKHLSNAGIAWIEI